MFKTRGLLISFEGIDGCGKSTQADLLLQRLNKEGLSPLFIREPGGTPVGEDIRQVILENHYSLSLGAELLLYMSARSELTGQVIIPALISGKIIICDRFTDSTLAYQGYGGGADLAEIRALNRIAARGITPALTFLFDLTVEDAAKRRKVTADRMESKDLFFHRRVRTGYLQLADAENYRFEVINAQDSIENIAELVWSHTKALLERTGNG